MPRPTPRRRVAPKLLHSEPYLRAAIVDWTIKTEGIVSKADDYRRSAEEARHWASRSTTARERNALTELARKWTLLADELKDTSSTS